MTPNFRVHVLRVHRADRADRLLRKPQGADAVWTLYDQLTEQSRLDCWNSLARVAPTLWLSRELTVNNNGGFCRELLRGAGGPVGGPPEATVR